MNACMSKEGPCCFQKKINDDRENVAEKVNSCSLTSFNLHRDYSKSLTFSNVGEPS